MDSTLEDYAQRFGGIGRLYGVAAMERLRAAHVAVVGVGGVGSWVVEALVRSGVGALTMIDMDDVCVTNINRQLPALGNTVGRPKAGVLAERCALINPACRVTSVLEFVSESNARVLLDQGFNFVVDAVDRMSIKAAIIATAHSLKVPVITLGSAGGRRDPTQIRSTDLGFAGGDELLKQVRRKLRKDGAFPKSDTAGAIPMGVPCIYSLEAPWFPQGDGTCAREEPENTEPGLRLDCAAGYGAATFVTGAFAFAAAAEVVRGLVE